MTESNANSDVDEMTVEEIHEGGLSIFAMIEKAREDGLNSTEREWLMDASLTDEQIDVIQNRAGDGRIKLTGERSDESNDASVPTLFNKLAEQKKIPWTFTLDGVDFVVRAKFGEEQGNHSMWQWRESFTTEDGEKQSYWLRFYNPERNDCVHSIAIERRDSDNAGDGQ